MERCEVMILYFWNECIENTDSLCAWSEFLQFGVFLSV